MKIRAWLIWSVVAAQVVLIALSILFDALVTGPSLGLDFVVGQIVPRVISILVFPAVGIVIFSQRPQHPIGWLFCALNLGWAINNFAGAYVRQASVTGKGSLPAVDFVAWLYVWPGNISVGLLILSVLLFPDGTLLSRRWRPVAWLVIGTALVGAFLGAFAPGPIDPSIGVAINNPLGLPGRVGDLVAQLSGLGSVLLPLLFIVAAISMLLRLRRAGGQERQQLKWFTSGFALETVLLVLSVVLMVAYRSQDAMPVWAQGVVGVGILGTAVVPVTAGIAILRYRLYDIDIVINRTLVYGALTMSLALVYFGSVVLLQAIFAAFSGQGNNDLAIVASTLAIAALFSPLRKRIQAFIDRRFYRRKYDAARTLAQFSETVRDEVDLYRLTSRLLEVVEETMQPAHASLWLRTPERKAASDE